MRLYPPVTFIQRVTTKDIVLDDHQIPAGTTIGVQIYNLHHNKAVWEDPYEFKPERFSPDKERKYDNFAFVPFSAGPRYSYMYYRFDNDEPIGIKEFSCVWKLWQ